MTGVWSGRLRPRGPKRTDAVLMAIHDALCPETLRSLSLSDMASVAQNFAKHGKATIRSLMPSSVGSKCGSEVGLAPI